MPEKIEAIERASGNLENVWTIHGRESERSRLLKYERLLVTREALAVIEASGRCRRTSASRAAGSWRGQAARRRWPRRPKMAELRVEDVIRRPLITEKNTCLMEIGQYTFEVASEANKIQIEARSKRRSTFR